VGGHEAFSLYAIPERISPSRSKNTLGRVD
jgi:hypothetical protein